MKTAIIFTNKELKFIDDLIEEKLDSGWTTVEEYEKCRSIQGYIQNYLKDGNK